MSNEMDVERGTRIYTYADTCLNETLNSLGDDVSILDVAQYANVTLLLCAKLISDNAYKNGKSVDVKTVINDLCDNALMCIDNIRADHPDFCKKSDD